MNNRGKIEAIDPDLQLGGGLESRLSDKKTP